MEVMCLRGFLTQDMRKSWDYFEHTLFNLSNLIKCFSTDGNLKPAYFKPKYEGYIEKSYLHNGEKHVNGEWLFKYLCSSKFSLRKQFIEWVCKQLAKEANNITMDINSINAPVPSNSINIKGVHMCCANCKSDVISPISGKITKKHIQQMKSKKSKDKLLKRIMNVFGTLLKNNGQNFEDIMIYYFKKEQNCFYNITRMFVSDDRDNLQKKSQTSFNILRIY
jgi:hypothetical protein